MGAWSVGVKALYGGAIHFVLCVLECRRLYNALKIDVLQCSEKENSKGVSVKEQKCAQTKDSIVRPPSVSKRTKCVSPESDAGVFGQAFNKSVRSAEDGPAMPSMDRLRKWSKPKHANGKFSGALGSKLEKKVEGCSVLTAEGTCGVLGSLGREDDSDRGLVMSCDMSVAQHEVNPVVSCMSGATPPPSPVQTAGAITPPPHTSDVASPSGSPTEVLLAGLYTTNSVQCEQLGNTFLHRLKGGIRGEEREEVRVEERTDVTGEDREDAVGEQWGHDAGVVGASHALGETPVGCEREESWERRPDCSMKENVEFEPPAKKQKRETASK